MGGQRVMYYAQRVMYYAVKHQIKESIIHLLSMEVTLDNVVLMMCIKNETNIKSWKWLISNVTFTNGHSNYYTHRVIVVTMRIISLFILYANNFNNVIS